MVAAVEALAVFLAAVVLLAVAVPFGLYYYPPRAVRVGLRAFERRTCLPPAYAAVVVGFSSAVVLALAAAVEEPGLVGGLAASGGVFGSLFLALALGTLPAARRYRTATAVDAGDPGTEAVVVDGSARPVDEALSTPAGEAVACAWVLQEEKWTHRSTVWTSRAEGERTLPFEVADDTGSVRVDADSLALRTGIGDAARRRTVPLPEGEPIPDDVREFLAAAGVDAPDRPDDDHRLKLRRVEPGSPLTAFGDHDRVVRDGESFWGVTAGAGDGFVFAGDADAVGSALRRRVRWFGVGGALATLVGVAYVAAQFGLV